MTSTATALARANSKGDPCPPWCATDHAAHDFHGSRRISFQAADYGSYSSRVVRWVTGDHVQVAGAAIAYVPARTAPDLADLIEGLATASPEDHRKLAAAIREAAAVITEAAGG